MIFSKKKCLQVCLLIALLFSVMPSSIVMGDEVIEEEVRTVEIQDQENLSLNPRGCADVNGDGNDNLSDAICLIQEAFVDGGCSSYVHDVNGDGIPNIVDINLIIRWMFWGGPYPC
jgi:hypothetical protein